MSIEASPGARARIHAALADPHRLRIVDELVLSDGSPSQLAATVGIGSNLLAHHLDVLEDAGVIERLPSAGDGRRRYVRLVSEAMAAIAGPVATLMARHVLFVCTANSARSQLAAAIWREANEVPASSAGTQPAAAVRPEAVRAAARAGLDIRPARTRSIDEVTERPDLIVTVCDIAREELGALPGGARLLHWSIPDPARIGTAKAFDDAVRRIGDRVHALAPRVQPSRRPRRVRP